MADNHFSSTIDALFKGMDHFVTTKTVVGEAVKIDDAIILPLVDVSCGMAAGAFADGGKNKDNGAGGMSAKMTPSAVLVIQNGTAKLVGGPKGAGEISPNAMEAAEEIAGRKE